METVERNILLAAAKKYRKQRDIAAGLSMSQPTVARKLQKYGIGSQFGRNR